MKTILINLYPLSELSETAREKALDDHRYTLVDGTWWENVYEDAAQIGLKITGFEMEQGYYCHAEWVEDAIDAAGKIIENHGPSTATYQIAIAFLAERNRLITLWPKDEQGELTLTGDFDIQMDSVEDNFLTAMRWAYHSMLIHEYNHLTGDYALTETFEENDYHFTADGKLATRLEKLTAVHNKN